MTISGKRVDLRPIQRSDATFLSQLDSDPAVRANVVGWGWPQSSDAYSDILQARAQDPRVQRWIIIENASVQPIGLAGLWEIDWRNGTAELGLKLGGEARPRGKGLGTDTILTLSAFAFMDAGLRRLYASVLASNTRSYRTFVTHCGWTHEATLRQHVIKGGTPVDCHLLGLLSSEFGAQETTQRHPQP